MASNIPKMQGPVEDSAIDSDFKADPAGVRDEPLRDSEGQPLSQIEGVKVQLLTPFTDHRGSLVEAINLEDPFWKEPVVHAYKFTVRPGKIKGWGMHRKQSDRYFICSGDMRIVLYDGRKDSPTHKHLAQYSFADKVSGLVYIPRGVWHADQNIGSEEAVVINFPTRPHDRSDPDKFRIDPHSGEIPFDWTLRDG